MRPARSALLALALLSGAAQAAEQRTSASVWASALGGTLQVGPGSADFDMSVGEILDVLAGTITLRHESRGETRGWYAELIYNHLEQGISGVLGERQTDVTQRIVELGVSHPLADDWDLYGGVRWVQVDSSIEFIVLPTANARTDWGDAVLGVRWHRENAGSRWWARGDAAGGGSGGAYLIEAGGAWRFAEAWELSLAYRMLDTRFEDGAILLDLQQVGAVIGVTRVW